MPESATFIVSESKKESDECLYIKVFNVALFQIIKYYEIQVRNTWKKL